MELTQKEKRSLGIKEIAKQVRERLAAEFPACKFSVTIDRYSMGQSLTVSLMSAPFPTFNQPTENKYTKVNHHWLKHTLPNETTIYTEECRTVLMRIKEIVNEYNYDNSDPVTDFYDVNFHFELNIGKWDKPFVQIGSTKPALTKQSAFKDIQRNENDVIRIQSKEYQSKEYIDIRVWYKDEFGEMKPTKKGIYFQKELLDDIIQQLQTLKGGISNE